MINWRENMKDDAQGSPVYHRFTSLYMASPGTVRPELHTNGFHTTPSQFELSEIWSFFSTLDQHSLTLSISIVGTYSQCNSLMNYLHCQKVGNLIRKLLIHLNIYFIFVFDSFQSEYFLWTTTGLQTEIKL